MSLPTLDRLRLTRTGEFYPLSRKQVKKLNREGAEEPITQRRFRRDVEPWHTFRVELKQPDGSFKDQFYHAESLWEWYQKRADAGQPPTDPLTRQLVWYEDWWALHQRFDPQGDVPDWARILPRLTMVKIGLEQRRRAADLTRPMWARLFEARTVTESPPPVPEPAPSHSAPIEQILAEEREAREAEVAEHRYLIGGGEEMWGHLIQDDDTSLATMLSRNRRLVYHEQYVHVHLVRLAAIARNADEGDRILREASEWEWEVLLRGASRQAWIRDKKGERQDGIAARQDAMEAADAQLERILVRESETTYRRH